MLDLFELETLRMRMDHPALKRLELYRRIQRVLKEMIEEGVLSAGIKLPSTRALSKSLDISRDTIENAYSQLHRDGYIVRASGAGSFVNTLLGTKLNGRRVQPIGLAQTPLTVANKRPELSARGAMIAQTQGIADGKRIQAFVTGLPETNVFPQSTWERIHKLSVREYRDSVLLHADPQGAKILRESIARYLNLERGAKVDPDQILVLSSTRQALFLCAQLLWDKGDAVLLEDPGYMGARKSFIAAELKTLAIAVDEEGVKTDLLSAYTNKVRGIYITPSHQYPTGVTLSLPRRLALVQWAETYKKWIIEDDYDSEFHYQGLPTACVQGLGEHQRTIYIGTFNKTLYPGLRIGYMVLPPSLVNTFVQARSIFDGHTPLSVQVTLARFMEEGHYLSHLRAMRKLYARRRVCLLDALDRSLRDWLDVMRPDGGLQLPCFLHPPYREAMTVAEAARQGLVLQGLSEMYQSKEKREGWLLGYSALSEFEIEKAVLQLQTMMKRMNATM